MGGQLMDSTEWLKVIKSAMDRGELSKSDLRSLVDEPHEDEPDRHSDSAQPADLSLGSQPSPAESGQQKTSKTKRSATNAIINVATVLVAVALLVFVYQGFDGAVMIGLVVYLLAISMWALGAVSKRSAGNNASELSLALSNSIIGTGSILVIWGAYQLSSGLFSDISLAGVALVGSSVVTASYLAYFQLVREPLLGVVATIVGVTMVPAFIHLFLDEQAVGTDWWIIIYALVGGLFMASSRIAEIFYPVAERKAPRHAIMAAGLVFTLAIVYVGAQISDNGAVWLLLIPAALALLFYISILRRSNQFLVIATIFLVIYLLRISFQFFSGYGISIALITSAMILVGIALAANHIKRTYIDK